MLVEGQALDSLALGLKLGLHHLSIACVFLSFLVKLYAFFI